MHVWGQGTFGKELHLPLNLAVNLKPLFKMSYKQGCDEHWGAFVSFNSGFLGVYAQQWDSWVIWPFYLQFFKESPHCSP